MGIHGEFVLDSALQRYLTILSMDQPPPPPHLHQPSRHHTSTLPFDRYDTRLQLKARLRDFVAAQSANSPPEVGPFYLASPSLLYLQSVEQARFTAWVSVASSTALAFAVLLLFTRNAVLTLLATANIVMIAVGVIGFISLLGWSLGLFECVCITLLVGFSVDYTVHLAIIYAESDPGLPRHERVRHAFDTLGVSVVAGAISTFGACAWLQAATITFLTKFGSFVLIAVALSFLYAMFMFPAMAAAVGPTRRRGELRCPAALCAGAAAKGQCRLTRCAVPARVCLGIGVAVPVAALAVSVVAHVARADARAAAGAPAADARPPLRRHLPRFAELTGPRRWHELRPAGRTRCARGTPYAFYVRPASGRRVVLDFWGGGACWSRRTCGLQTRTFADSVEGLRTAMARDDFGFPANYSRAPGRSAHVLYRGLASDPGARLSGFTHVLVPYCTGDVHWGNASVEYMPGLTVHHRGADNAMAVVEWLTANFEAPEVVLVTGCSAGSYGSLLYAARLAAHFGARGTRVVQFGDSGLGVAPRSFLRDAYPQWNVAAVWPWDVVPADLRFGRSNAAFYRSNLTMAAAYLLLAEAFPNATFSQFTTAYDFSQAYFHSAMHDDRTSPGEPPRPDKLRWAAEMRRQYAVPALLARPNYLQWIGNGDSHCIINGNRFWWTRAPGVGPISEWLSGMIAGTVPDGSRIVDCAVPRGSELDLSACEVGLETAPPP